MSEPSTMSARIAGAARPEKDVVRIGYLPLSDCASLVMASMLGFDQKYGIKIELSSEASWARVRDKLGNGELDAAHVLYGLVYGVQMGIGGQARDMAVLMNLNQNGQAVTVSSSLAQQGAVDGASLAGLMRSTPRTAQQPYTFAQTFPTGNHAMYLSYWLAAHGIDPLNDVRLVTVPPPQMLDNLHAGRIDGFCVGAPWGLKAVADKTGVTAATTQQIWPDHPGKVLGASAGFADQYPNTCRALIAALLDAGKWLEATLEDKQQMLETMGKPDYMNASGEWITPRLLEHYLGNQGDFWTHPNGLQFYQDGAVTFPYLSDGMWFMTQHRRWGLLKDDPDYLAVASKVNRIGLYRQAAEMTGTPLPPDVLRSSTLIDGVVWDGAEPERYAASFAIRK